MNKKIKKKISSLNLCIKIAKNNIDRLKVSKKHLEEQKDQLEKKISTIHVQIEEEKQFMAATAAAKVERAVVAASTRAEKAGKAAVAAGTRMAERAESAGDESAASVEQTKPDAQPTTQLHTNATTTTAILPEPAVPHEPTATHDSPAEPDVSPAANSYSRSEAFSSFLLNQLKIERAAKSEINDILGKIAHIQDNIYNEFIHKASLEKLLEKVLKVEKEASMRAETDILDEIGAIISKKQQ